ncbi:hypothetical protein LEP1GSC035_0932 [Leptospira noguchii str. 2007001578]|uniref:Uncharacterized protein n=1 Tax=Leptospira noguchii str. 2007001578 TaxID=1049974 RepID=A0ABN0IWQ3_9LEPT|nr:hypothetical protein LEP1GSC035_0932 [Leptospira noguchii str. 2007001578]
MIKLTVLNFIEMSNAKAIIMLRSAREQHLSLKNPEVE